MISKLKAHGTKCLKLKYDSLLSSFNFNFNLRRFLKELDLRGNQLTSVPAQLGVGQCWLIPRFASTE